MEALHHRHTQDFDVEIYDHEDFLQVNVLFDDGVETITVADGQEAMEVFYHPMLYVAERLA